MKAYHFSLSTVLRIRALEERLARERLLVAQRALRTAHQEHQALAAKLGELTVPSRLTTIEEIRWVGDQAQRLNEQIRVRHERVVEVSCARDQANAAWTAARKRTGALERLEAQSVARWRHESERSEVAELDDVANARHRVAGVNP
ncbi:MAG TPA: flagellar FliJ family protein [Acidimicrobiales bacterium]|nr:flagellar FliJ family protein [Acidimicrobiales bacterium]